MRSEHGFSLVEMTIAVAVMLTVTASVFSLMNPAQGTFSAQPEVSDMQQRLRVATDSLSKDLVMTGGGAYQGSMGGSLGNYFATVQPRRVGSTNEDAPTVFKTDTITLIYVPPTIAQTTLATHGPSLNSAEIGVNAESGCPNGDDLCGFKEGMTVLMYDASGNYDIFTITNVQTNALHLQHNSDSLTYTGYDANTTKIVQVANFVYYLNTATLDMFAANGTPGVDNVGA
jgi:prepilin-type N-terminal cleavage/methylation domain-containing protein